MKKDNLEVRKWEEPQQFSFTLSHFELGERLNILVFSRAGKVTVPDLLL